MGDVSMCEYGLYDLRVTMVITRVHEEIEKEDRLRREKTSGERIGGQKVKRDAERSNVTPKGEWKSRWKSEWKCREDQCDNIG